MYVFNVFSNAASKVMDKHSHIIQRIVSWSPFFSIWGLILVSVEPASSLNLAEILIFKSVLVWNRGFPLSGLPRDASPWWKASELWVQHNGKNTRVWASGTWWCQVSLPTSPLLIALTNNPSCWIVLTADSSSPPHFHTFRNGFIFL